ncbi:uncharacterized protein LTR77_008159 [Saxophila tyrrhenica]|uniref:F-box domain-containing protein n=1 Tax=Saxophila tyrrhenica TaxID=1690608 RepID=A0AAV9P4S6_9PEZI|nr:hypothetical protein LTR77_008159 [Saxophila tyrrhenica]
MDITPDQPETPSSQMSWTTTSSPPPEASEPNAGSPDLRPARDLDVGIYGRAVVRSGEFAPSHMLRGRNTRSTTRWVQAQSERRNMASPFNPEAAPFNPPGLMRSKRKASSPTEKPPGKAIQSSSNAVSRYQYDGDVPTIEAKQVFATGDFTSSDRATPDLSEQVQEYSDDEDIALDILERVARGPSPDNFQTNADVFSTSAFRTKEAFKKRRREAEGRKFSAVLVSRHSEACPTSNTSPKFSDQVRYLALAPASRGRINVENSDYLTVLPEHRNHTQQTQQTQQSGSVAWPRERLPVELFDLITDSLARDDVMSMRLVNREFEQKVSRSLFHTSVVPFNTELYDMIDDRNKLAKSQTRPIDKGKGKARVVEQYPDPPGLHWQNAKVDQDGKVYKGHGLRVFQGFGPHIRRFGMSFEVSEKQLCQPLNKKVLDEVTSYHGSYEWPAQHYARFANLAGLENTADETSRMKAAFSNLEHVRELGLALDSGLGWLSGPDKSVRARVFERQSPVFGSVYNVPDHALQAAGQFWSALKNSQLAFHPTSNMKEITLDTSPTPVLSLSKLGEYSDVGLWPTVSASRIVSTDSPKEPTHADGVVFTTDRADCGFDTGTLPLAPCHLKQEQKEWLLETQWAQQAFLESYMLAVIDNPNIFKQVTTLNIAKLSSRFVPMLSRPYIWAALPCLADVNLQISPDWRSVDKDSSAAVVEQPVWPSAAVDQFHNGLLQQRIAQRQTIKKLTIGWVGGGEHAEGICGRNNGLLPAPIIPRNRCTENSGMHVMVFSHVEHLTLSNCWVTPVVLESLVKKHEGMALKKLTLDSVSLTTHPRNVTNDNAVAAVQNFNVPQNAQGQHAALFAQVHQHLQQIQQGNQQMQQLVFGHNGNQNAPNPLVPPANQAIGPNWTQVNFALTAQAGGVNGAAPIQINPLNIHPAPVEFNAHWSLGHGEGLWPDVLNKISPGPVFNDYLPAPAAWEEQHPERPESALQTLELKSCGYVLLPNFGGFDQSALLSFERFSSRGSLWFEKRRTALKNVMMHTTDSWIGKIVQRMPVRELDALRFAWGLREGWEDLEKAEEPTYDGALPGGTGRVSGVITKGMGLIGETEKVGKGKGKARAL